VSALRTTRRAPAEPWTRRDHVPWPDTGDPHLNLLRAAVEARLYPYGDLVSSPGRPVASYQLSLLDRGRAEGMDDREVGAFLSANLMCGLTTVYRRTGPSLEAAGSVAFAGRQTDPDVMGRRGFYWRLEVRPGRGGCPEAAIVWQADALCDAFRRAFGVPRKALPPEARNTPWENDQGLLF
jgi:hypothetical protein